MPKNSKLPTRISQTRATAEQQRRTMNISKHVLRWFDHHGRKDLPWQQQINPYRVWVSEIMLQQTQVSTVIPYFDRFMAAMPTIAALAKATEDQVLHLWTGLGYYSRARNLHKTAKQICAEWGGQFPDTVEQLSELPGIGRSTAGAIVSIAFCKPAAILDGNVKRVLARFHAIAGWPGQTAVLNRLWDYAECHRPTTRVADYSQAMMDLGATVCTRKPACDLCPLAENCLARTQGNPGDYPGKKPPKALPVKTTQMLIIRNSAGEVLLEKRPAAGIWGGLWIFPQLPEGTDIAAHCNDVLGLKPSDLQHWQPYRHTFSHYHLDISPVVITLARHPSHPNYSYQVMENDQQLWYNLQKPAEVGLAAPIKKLLSKLSP